MIGTTLNHYAILEQIGKGGMGEVYLAEDTRLGRKVALKVLAPEVAGDEALIERFEREARTLATINHPNIVTIHSVESAPGSNGETVHFLTMELVEGRSLDQLTPEAGMSLDRFFELAVPMADALAAAHDQGITHRDLKPANVMVADGGRLKVLDFGLAKRQPAEEEAAGEQTELLTEAGMVMGTIPYMSPEQVQGKPLDRRSDIFSLGIMLYEMATGRRPFAGDSSADLMSAILRDAPPSVTELNLELPRHLARIVRRCLEKDPQRRFQTALDLRNELDELKREVESGETLATSAAVAAMPASKSKTPWIATAAAALALVVVGWLILGRESGSPADPGATSAPAVSQSMSITRLTSHGRAQDSAISPDGRLVVHVLEGIEGKSLRVRQVATSSDVEIVPPARVDFAGLTFSPDGDYVYFVREGEKEIRGDLFVVPSLGGQERKLIEQIDSSISLSPDGGRVAFMRSINRGAGKALLVANLDGSGETELTRGQELDFLSGSPAWSPDGERIAVTGGFRPPRFEERVYTIPTEGGELEEASSRAWPDISDFDWLADGTGLVAAAVDYGGKVGGHQLWGVPFPDGDVWRITNDLYSYRRVSVAATGRSLATVLEEWNVDLSVAPAADPSERRKISVTSRAWEGRFGVSWTTDGRLVVPSLSDGKYNLWVVAADGSDRRQITTGSWDNQPVVCGDEEYVLYMSSRMEGTQVWGITLGGSEPRQMTFAEAAASHDCSPDGEWLLYRGREDLKWSVYRVPIAGGEPELLSDQDVLWVQYSSRGDRILFAYFDREANRVKLAIMPAEGGDPVRQMEFPGAWAAWAPGGDAIDYVENAGGTSTLYRRVLAGGEPLELVSLEDDQIFSFAWSRDQSQLALSHGARLRDVVLIRDF